MTAKPLDLNRHLSTCKELGLSDQLTALTNAASKGGGTASSAGAAENAQAGAASGASTSNQQKRLNSPMKKYLDKAAIGPHEMRRLQLMLALCFVMCGWSVRSAESPFLTRFCQNLQPNLSAHVSAVLACPYPVAPGLISIHTCMLQLPG